MASFSLTNSNDALFKTKIEELDEMKVTKSKFIFVHGLFCSFWFLLNTIFYKVLLIAFMGDSRRVQTEFCTCWLYVRVEINSSLNINVNSVFSKSGKGRLRFILI